MSQLEGKLSFITDREGFESPMVVAGKWDIEFSADRTVADASSFKPMKIGPFPVSFGPIQFDDTLTVKLQPGNRSPPNGVGSFDPATRKLLIPMRFVFRHSLAAAGPSGLQMVLSTETRADLALRPRKGKRPPDSDQPVKLRLVGNGTFTGGPLDGNVCSVSIDGTLTPSPLA